MRNPRTEAGASDRLAGHAEASTPNYSAAQRPDAIDVFMPGIADDERGLRVRIHRAQGAMTTKATRSKHGRARAHYWWGSQLAADWVFRPAPVEDLTEILWALSRTFLSAGAIERLELPDAD